MRFTVDIDCDNDAFGDRDMDVCDQEVARILRHLASQIEEGYLFCYLTDSNGNRVGIAGYK